MAYHAGPDKSVVLARLSSHQPTLVLVVKGASSVKLIVKHAHRYLGLHWPADLNFLPSVVKQIAIAGSMAASVAGLVESGLPVTCHPPLRV